MTNAQERVNRAQAAYDVLVQDNVRFTEAVDWLEGAVARGNDFHRYYQDHWLDDREEVGVHLPVMGEDESWDALGDYLEQVRRLLRIATDGVLGPPELAPPQDA